MLLRPSRGDPESLDIHKRLTAVSELVASTDQEALDTLTQLVSDTEPRVAKAAIRAIGSRSDQPARLKLKQIAEKNNSGTIRGAAAAELGNFEKTDYRLLTDILLTDKDPKARAGAAKGLKRLHKAGSVDSLVKALSDPDANVRGNAFEAIGRATGRWFKFNPTAPLAARAKAITEIKKELARIRVEDPHTH